MAATDLERLVVQLSADFKQFERSMARAEGVSNKQFNAIERRARQMNRNLDSIGKQAARSIIAPLAGIGAALGVREIARLTDTWTDLTSRVNIAAGSMEAGTVVMGRLGEMARRTYSSLEQTVESYVANSTALRELGYSTKQQLDYTEALNNALVVSGAKGQRAAQIQDALAKAMAGGKLSGQELNTVIQSGGRVAEALAKGLGVGVNQLRALGAAGKITSRDVFQALTSQMETLRNEAESMPATISDGIQLLNYALLQYVGNADSATGISAKISEALIMMADNFDTVADAGLQLAAVLAAGLLGRSIAGMVRTLGLGSTALIQFTRALTAARTMASLQVAFGGLAAAAGPAGVVIGAGLATALVAAHASAQTAEDRIGRLNVEMERLGNRGRLAKEGVDEAGEAIEDLVDQTTAQRLRDINDELERLRGGGNWSSLFGRGDEFGSLITRANDLKATLSGFGGLMFGNSEERQALDAITRVADGLRNGKVLASEARAEIERIGQLDLDRKVLDLNAELAKTVDWWARVRAQQVAEGDLSELEDYRAKIQAVRDELQTMAETRPVSQKQYNELDGLIERFQKGEASAEETIRAIDRVAGTNLEARGVLSGIDQIINGFVTATAAIGEFGAALSGVGGGLTREQIDAYQQYGASRVAGVAVDQSSQAYIAEAQRRAGLSREQLALETEIARVREQSLKDGEMLTEQQIREVARINLSGNKDRADSAKKPKKERADDYQRLAERITDATAAMVAETEVQRQLNPLIDDYGYAVEKARTEQDLLNAAKKAGVEVTPALRDEISNLAHQYATATAEAGKLAETQDEIRRRAEDMADFQKDLTRGIVDGFVQGKKAADIFAEALSKIGNKLLDLAFNSFFDTKGGGGGGFMGGFFKMLGFADGGYTGPGGKHQPAGVVHKGEVVWSQKDVAAAGGVAAVEAMRLGRAGYANGGPVAMPTLPSAVRTAPQGGNMTVDARTTIHAPNADKEGLARLEALMRKRDAELPSTIVETVRKAQSGRMLGG